MGTQAQSAQKAIGERLRAVIADDDPLARRVIKDVLERAGVIVIAEARDGRQAVQLTLHYLPDVVVMDVVMREFDGIMATREIRRQLPEQLIIVLTSAGSDNDELGMLALRAGASGFMSKDDLEIEALPRALEGLRQGQAAISRKLTLALIERLREAPNGSSGMRPVKSSLTAREWEVIDLVKESKTTDEIADELVLSPETIRSHVKHILRKLKVRSRQEAVAAADKMRNAGPPAEGPESGSP